MTPREIAEAIVVAAAMLTIAESFINLARTKQSLNSEITPCIVADLGSATTLAADHYLDCTVPHGCVCRPIRRG